MTAKPRLAKQPDNHGEALNSPRQFFGVFRYSKRALELLWSTSRKLSFLLAFVTVLAGVLPSAVAWVGARIVDSVVARDAHAHRRQRRGYHAGAVVGARGGADPRGHHGGASRHHAVPVAAQGETLAIAST